MNESPIPSTDIPVSTGKRNRARLTIVGLFALFFVPIFVSMYLNFAHPGWLPFGTVNRGALLKPPPQLELVELAGAGAGIGAPSGDSQLAGHWTWAVLASDCDEACETLLARVAKARIALGRNIQRVQPALLTRNVLRDVMPGALASQIPSLSLEAETARAIDNAIARAMHEEAGASAASEPRLLLIDPQTFVIAAYAHDSEVEHWLKDARRLLRISKLDQAN